MHPLRRTCRNFLFASGHDGSLALPASPGIRVCVSFATDSMAISLQHPDGHAEQSILAPRAAIVVPRKASAEVRWIGAADVLVIALDDKVLSTTARNLGVPKSLPPTPTRIADPAIHNITGMVRDLIARDQDLPEPVASSATQLLAVRLLSQAARPPVEGPKERLSPSALRRTLEFVDGHLIEDFALEDMANAAGCSRYHFARAFRSSTGVSPWRYVTGRRLKQAETLLRTRETLSVAEVCHMVGFQDQSHFTRAFKSAFSLTPGNFRRRAIGAAA